MARKTVNMETPSGVIAKVNSDGVIYKHYIITQHALVRFQQRSGMTLDNLFVTLDRAVLAEVHRAKDNRIQQQIRKSEKQGGYAMFDPETDVYFFMAVGPRYHTICTIMTKELMTYVS
ncbi:hypothetical protein D0Q53_20695 [Salmonella enterica]|nr:hypothetical protein [Salmonella enterica]EFF4796147.1 hypothetical protein [Escherichia coli]EBJ6658337.1 hypothetical protein [Salmonella enterica]EBL0923949.1 hypothetical protein [Salmonella enterica]ECO7324739.1 hypothetical protein [Salmonella enterica]